MGPRPRHVLFGLLVLVAALWAGASLGSRSTRPAAATEAPSPVVHGVVAADGAVRADGAWIVEHPEDGHYVLTLPGVHVALDVDAWDVAGSVTIKPLGGGAHDLRFTGPDGPIDTAFDFVAVLEP